MPWLLLLPLALGCSQSPAEPQGDPVLPVKVVIVTMFEIGEDEGDAAGEFQLWQDASI